MQSNRKFSPPLAALALIAAIAGFLLASYSFRDGEIVERMSPVAGNTAKQSPDLIFSPNIQAAATARRKKLAPAAGSIKNEMLARFPNAAAMQAFLDRATRAGARVLGIIPELNAARIGFDNAAQGDDIAALAPESAQIGFNFILTAPAPPDPTKQDIGGPYQPFDNGALPYLGVPADNSSWGQGVKVALLDTGVTSVPGLSSQSISTLDLVGQPVGAPDTLQHGTAMASIIAGDSPEAPGVAPAAQVLSVRVLDSNGIGDSFTVAQGIIDSVNNGAQVISMSLGSTGDSSVLHDAVNYALANNVAVVAAVGNDGSSVVDFPAQYLGVIGVTAVDASGQRAQFANYGTGVAIAAPGVDIYTPWTPDTVSDITGTSPAVPFVSGALAAILSQNPGMTARDATTLLLQYANDAGAPGPDPMYGAGILSIDRVMDRNVPGINDAAVADIYYGPLSGQATPQLAVTVQNRGTTTLYNVTLDTTVAGVAQTFNISSLTVGQVASQVLAVDPAQVQSTAGVAVSAQVLLNGATDANPSNNGKSGVLRKKQ